MIGDAMKMSDGVTTKLECGHPNVNPGETCSLCGQIFAPAAEYVEQAKNDLLHDIDAKTQQAATQPQEENSNE